MQFIIYIGLLCAKFQFGKMFDNLGTAVDTLGGFGGDSGGKTTNPSKKPALEQNEPSKNDIDKKVVDAGSKK